MEKRIMTYTCLVSAIIACGCAKQPANAPHGGGNETRHLVLDLSRLASLPVTDEHPAGAGDIQRLHLGNWTDVASDGPRFFLWRDHSGNMWIMKSGEFSGETRWFGPFERLEHGGITIRNNGS